MNIPHLIGRCSTPASHMPRAVRHFQWVGLDPLPAPTQRLTVRLEPDRLGYWIR